MSECSKVLRSPIVRPMPIPASMAAAKAMNVRPSVIPMWKYADFPSGPRLTKFVPMVVAISIGPGRTSTSSINMAVTHQMKSRTKIDPTLRQIPLAREDIYSCSSKTLKNSLTNSFSISKITGSSGFRGLGTSTVVSLKIRAGFVLIM